MLIISELLELGINYFVYQNRDRLIFIQPLQGKIFKFKFLELEYPIILYFDTERVYVFNEWIGQINCLVQICLIDFFMYLTKKQESVYNKYYVIHGDISVLEDLIQFIDGIKLNFTDFFFPHINPIIFESILDIVQYYLFFLKNKIDIIKLCWIMAITDEWKFMPNYLEVSWFYKDIQILKKKKEFLFKRFQELK